MSEDTEFTATISLNVYYIILWAAIRIAVAKWQLYCKKCAIICDTISKPCSQHWYKPTTAVRVDMKSQTQTKHCWNCKSSQYIAPWLLIWQGNIVPLAQWFRMLFIQFYMLLALFLISISSAGRITLTCWFYKPIQLYLSSMNIHKPHSYILTNIHWGPGANWAVVTTPKQALLQKCHLMLYRPGGQQRCHCVTWVVVSLRGLDRCVLQ